MATPPFLRRGQRRGMALLAAISVLAVLTILVFSLAAARQAESAGDLRSEGHRQAQATARFGLDAARSLLAKSPDALAGGGKTFSLEYGTCTVSALRAGPDAPAYANAFFKQRPGDTVVRVRVAPGRRRVPALDQTYLVNAVPGSERTVRLENHVGR